MSKFDITDCTDEEIVDELGRRYLGIGLVVLKEFSDEEGVRNQACQTWFRGGWAQAVGLFRFGEQDILNLRSFPDGESF
tara:strand:- start:165 stop:401 length:237 start_codon:yes stop_codon:yes gene_type:complete